MVQPIPHTILAVASTYAWDPALAMVHNLLINIPATDSQPFFSSADLPDTSGHRVRVPKENPSKNQKSTEDTPALPP